MSAGFFLGGYCSTAGSCVIEGVVLSICGANKVLEVSSTRAAEVTALDLVVVDLARAKQRLFSSIIFAAISAAMFDTASLVRLRSSWTFFTSTRT